MVNFYDIVDGNLQMVHRSKMKDYSDKFYNSCKTNIANEDFKNVKDVYNMFNDYFPSEEIIDNDLNYFLSIMRFVSEYGCNSLVVDCAIDDEDNECWNRFWNCVEYFKNIKSEFGDNKDFYYKLTNEKIEEYKSYLQYKENSNLLDFVRDLVLFDYDVEKVKVQDRYWEENNGENKIGNFFDKIAFGDEVDGEYQIREYIHYWNFDSGYCDALRISWT